MDERLRFVARLLEGEKMAPLCAEFGISRKTGYDNVDNSKHHVSRRKFRRRHAPILAHAKGWLGRCPPAGVVAKRSDYRSAARRPEDRDER